MNVVKKVGYFILGIITGIIALLYGRKKILDNRDTVAGDRKCQREYAELQRRTEHVERGLDEDISRISELTEQIRNHQKI